MPRQRFNPANMTNAAGQQLVKRYVHQPLTIEHYDYHAKIKENGRVEITGPSIKLESGEIEFDQIEVPASLIFKLANLLEDTRQTKYVPISEFKAQPAENDRNEEKEK
jgi:hypothetical protein